MNGVAPEPDRAGLRWRCRRGMRELDVLLTGWFNREYARAPDDLRQQFAQLLEHEDDRLWDWLSGRRAPESGLEEIVTAVRGHGNT